MPLNLQDLEHYTARCQKAILTVVDRVPDAGLRDELRRTVLDALELMKRRVVADVQGGAGDAFHQNRQRG